MLQSRSTAESSSYCFSQYWNGTIPMSQWGCANSPFTQTVESTFVGNQVSVTGSGTNSITGSAQTTSQSGSSPTGSTSTGSSSSNHSSLSTAEIIGIAIGSVIALLIILGVLKELIHPRDKHQTKQSDDNPHSQDIKLTWGPPPGHPPPPVPHITNIYNHSPSPPINNPSQREYFRYSPDALSHENIQNMDRLHSDYTVGHARTVGTVSNDGLSDVSDLRGFQRSQRSDYGGSHMPPSEISASPSAQRFIRF